MDHPERDCQPTGHLDRLIALLQRSQTASSRDARLHWAVLLWLVLCWLGTSICLAGPNPAADKLLEEKLEPWCYHLYQSHAVDTLLAGSHARCSPGEACLPLSPFFHVDLALLNQGYLRVQLDTGPGDAAAADLQAACEARVPSLRWEGATGQWGQATLAIADLPRLAEVSGLFLITRPPTGLPLTTSEGVEEIGAEAYHALKLAGSDICVGVLDIGFTGADDLLGVELPADTRMSAFAKNANGDKDLSGGGSVHGTACAEIVHDIAPAAALCLANAGTIVEMEMAIHWLQDQGVSVISHSVGWFWGPGDGTGTIVDLTHEAIDAGILWVNAAGNQATRYWGGPFRDTNNDGWHEFDEAGDETITEESVAKGTAFTLVLTWDRWPYSPDLSFQIEIRENGRLVASSEDAYTSESYAYREIPSCTTISNGSTVEIFIHRDKGTEPAQLRLFRINGNLAEHGTPNGSLVLPADSDRVLSVGAYRIAHDTRLVEEFSSRGPTLAGVAKPELCGLDRVTTVSQSPFLGTSAACPLVAGAAALLLDAAPEGGFFDFRWSIPELRRLLEWSSLPTDLGDPHAYVWGLVHLPDPHDSPAIQLGPRLLIPSPTRPPVQARLSDAGPEPLRLQVFDALGRCLAVSSFPASTSSPVLTWDGRGSDGRTLPGGFYVLSVTGSGWASRQGMLLIR